MKKLLLITVGFTVASLQASIVSWTAGSTISLTSSYKGGTAYFLEVASEGPTLTQMIDAIKQEGLSGSNDDVTLLGTDTIISEGGYVGTEGQTLSPSVTENESSTYYVLFVDKDGKNFLFSDGSTVEDWIGVGINPQYNLTFIEENESGIGSWAGNGGQVGGGPVPEPTALALLALGVAGVALRRRVA